MADGSIKMYNYERTIKLKGRKTLPEELTNEIKLKYSYGVTKRRLASDFKLSIYKINRIIDGYEVDDDVVKIDPDAVDML
jgi:hypothetical protein